MLAGKMRSLLGLGLKSTWLLVFFIMQQDGDQEIPIRLVASFFKLAVKVFPNSFCCCHHVSHDERRWNHAGPSRFYKWGFTNIRLRTWADFPFPLVYPLYVTRNATGLFFGAFHLVLVLFSGSWCVCVCTFLRRYNPKCLALPALGMPVIVAFQHPSTCS